MYNKEAAIELVLHYKSITLEQLRHEWTEWEKETEEDATGGDILGSLTGFGVTGTCPLCQSCNTQCGNCVHSLEGRYNGIDYPCIDVAYRNIDNALTPEDLYTALQSRIDLLESLLNVCP